MTYNRVLTPRAYMDRLSFDLANGFRTASNYTVLNDAGGAVTFDAGQKEDLFDMRPSNFAQIAHDTKKFYIQIDTGMSSDTVAEANFLAILGHNFEEASAMFRLIHDDASAMTSSNSVTAVAAGTGSVAVSGLVNATQSTVTVDSGATTAESLDGSETSIEVDDASPFTDQIGSIISLSGKTERMKITAADNASSPKTITVVRNVHGVGSAQTATTDTAIFFNYGDCIQPANNGWTLITWANNNTDNQYYRLEIIDNAGPDSNFASDVKIGSIMLGEYIDFPRTPDLNLGFDIDYDGTKIVTSSGGSTFANTSYLGSPVWAKTNPWILAASASENIASKNSKAYGRRKYNMNFSYVADTDLFQANMHAAHGAMIDGSDLYSQFFHKSLGSHLPFLLTIDKDNTTTPEGDYGLFRLANGGLNSTQSAHRFWDTKLNLVEHW